MKYIYFLFFILMSSMVMGDTELFVGVESTESVDSTIICSSPECTFNLGAISEDATLTGHINHNYPQVESATSFFEHVNREWVGLGLELMYPKYSGSPIQKLITIMSGYFVSKEDFVVDHYKQKIVILEEELKYLKSLNNVNQDELNLQICLRLSKDKGEPVFYKEIECMWYDN